MSSEGTNHGIIGATIGAVVALGAWFLSPRKAMEAEMDSAIHKTTWVNLRISKMTQLTHNVMLMRVSFPRDKKVDIPVGHHVMLALDIDGRQVFHPYTPVEEGPGFFDVVFKIYPSGRLTPHLALLKPGDLVQVRGPTGRFKLDAALHNVFMVAGGSGITPMMQFIERLRTESLNKGTDIAEMRLVYSNHAQEDIIMRDRLDKLQLDIKQGQMNENATKIDRCDLVYVVTREQISDDSAARSRIKDDEQWLNVLVGGRVGSDLIESVFGSRSHPRNKDKHVLVLVCGPQGLVQATKDICQALGYSAEELFVC